MKRLTAIAVAMLALLAVAVADHADKNARMRRADVPHWYCTHEGTRCGQGDPDAIERNWQWRERAYWVLFIGLGAAGAAAAAGQLRHPRRRAAGLSS